jgi:Flp pilus assembly pilin Flp
MVKRINNLPIALALLFGAGVGRDLRRAEGQTLAEYALILALIAVAAFGAIFFLRTQITSLFSDIGNNL